MRIYPVISRTTVFLLEIPHKVQLVARLSSFYSQVHVNKSRKTHLHTDSRLGQSRGGPGPRASDPQSAFIWGLFRGNVPQSLRACRFSWSTGAARW